MSQRPRLVLTFDLEDSHQIVHRTLGVADWDRPHEAFERQVGTLLGLLDELDVRATFFVLGMCAKNHPDAVREIAARGHELASHGFEHVPVHRQTPDDFRRDVEASIELVESLAGRRPVGCRAPALLTEPSLLDVGCGSGRVGERVLDAGASRYVGVDFSAPMLSLARDRLARFGEKAELVEGTS